MIVTRSRSGHVDHEWFGVGGSSGRDERAL